MAQANQQRAAAARKEIDRIRKITVKTVCGKVNFEEVMERKQIDLMAVYGVARGMSPGASEHGPYVAFIGDFRAVNLKNGEEFASAKIIMPKIIEEQIAGAGPGGSGDKEIKFAFQLGVKYDAEAATKYVYTFRPLLETADASVMDELRGAVTKALPAPKK